MQLRSFLPACMVLCLIVPNSAWAHLRLYVGTMDVVEVSGRACAGLKRGGYPVSVVITTDDESGTLSGYIGGDSVTIGQLSGPSTGSLIVRYPYPDAGRAEGHTLHIKLTGRSLTGELRDRHIDASVADCNFDLARLSLQLSDDEESARTAYQKMARRYESLRARHAALELYRTGAYEEAVDLYEQALSLARQDSAADPNKLTPYLAGLASSYMRLGRYEDFNCLFAEHSANIKDAAVLQMFRYYRIQSLLMAGQAAMGREDYAAALDQFRQVIELDYKNKNAISFTITALVRNGQYDEAITFLEQIEQKLGTEPNRRDVRGVIALVQYHKAKNDHKLGRVKEAEAALRKAIQLDPDSGYYLILLARWRHKAGHYSEADGILKKAMQRFRDDAIRQELSAAREKLRQTEQILAKIRRAED